MKQYKTRALEVHDFVRIWDLAEVRRRLAFMVANDMNALVLHEPGIVDKLVFPAQFLGGESRGENLFELYQQIDHNIYYYALRENLNPFRRDYLTQLIAEARDAGIDVYLEDKELWFKDFILKSHPEILKNGVFCPSKSFWWEDFLPAKYRELFIMLPDLAGVVTSFGTGESRLAISNMFACDCEECKNINPATWHRNMVRGMYGSFRDAGKKLVIRDFIYQKEEQDQFAQALEILPIEIALSLKNTPHDFYPTFPDNPLIGKVGSREQWIEYDVYGQYFGWGIAPSIMTDDLTHRLQYGLENNVSGYIMRTDWEGVQDYSCFDTANLINLYAAAILGRNPDAEKREIYTRWIVEEKLTAETTSPKALKDCVDWAMKVMEQTWPLMKKTAFVNGTVFSDNSAFHVNLGQPTWVAETHHSLKNWQTGAKDALAMDDDNVRAILTEKDEAHQLTKALFEQVSEGNPGFKQEVYDDLVQRFDFFRVYAEGFRLTTRIYIFGRLLEERKDNPPSFLSQSLPELLEDGISQLKEYQAKLTASGYFRSYPANVLLGYERLSCYLKDAQRRLTAAS